jgi:chromosome segregation protein
MQIDRLRLVGFKSFADAAEVAIGPGLTGIVGPNGCGKSNLAEALRWVMGENSARRLRGGVMDDVIFGGAAGRPARNVAEVLLSLDNRARDAPFAFNDREEIEIVRRMERGVGSLWRINGREVRARDVQLLFADAATGGPSGAIVSQGRVGALIEAKPAERRFLLEEAAGTAGLHARRRETELKLAAAENNLTRLDDVTASLTTRLTALRKQARQAQRYRRLSDQIRRHEALLFHARWLAAESEAENRATELSAAEGNVTEATACALAERRAHEMAEAALPPLRRAETEAEAELQRLTQRRDALEHELTQVVAARREAERRLAELLADLGREDANLIDAEAALARLGEERRAFAAAEAEDDPALMMARSRLREIASNVVVAETGLQRAAEAAAAAAARRGAIAHRRRELAERYTRLEARFTEAEGRRTAVAATTVPPDAMAAGVAAVAEAEARAEDCRAALEAAQREIAARHRQEAAAFEAARRTAARLSQLEAEAAALNTLLVPDTEDGVSALSALRVAEGFEAAVGAAFEDDLSAPLVAGDGDAVQFWVDLGAIEGLCALPHGAHALTEVVNAPPALDRSLAQVGWVEDAAAGRSLQQNLAPGQRLVGRDGCLWRWDGFTRLAARPSAAAQHLRHKNRLLMLAEEIGAAAKEARSAETEAAAATVARQAAAEADRLARLELREAEATLAHARKMEAGLAHQALTAETRLAAAAADLDKFAVELAETLAQAERTRQELAALPQPGPARAALDAARVAVSQTRRDEVEAQGMIDRLTRENQSRRERLGSIDLEERSWRGRADGSIRQRATLNERRLALEAEITEIARRPAAIVEQTETLGDEVSAAAETCRRAVGEMAIGESRLRAAVDSARRADQALAGARESCARLEVQCDGARQAVTGLAREIRERIDAAPDALRDLSGLAPNEAPADAAATTVRLTRLTHERDGIGPINLVAENEAAELGEQAHALARERADLTGAIAKLRRAAAALDQEGRQLLAAAFKQVNEHFTALFTRLFGGGTAQLALTDDGDPLAAGLEIMASPTGKRLQTLSLLSGGEQALTALALLFSVFLTKPAPICVLDEVDAPLDDANVDRLCSLAAEIADTTGTRFLLITHHRITMARADRLFGVTMAEPGVSQLVSVDLARVARLRRTA